MPQVVFALRKTFAITYIDHDLRNRNAFIRLAPQHNLASGLPEDEPSFGLNLDLLTSPTRQAHDHISLAGLCFISSLRTSGLDHGMVPLNPEEDVEKPDVDATLDKPKSQNTASR